MRPINYLNVLSCVRKTMLVKNIFYLYTSLHVLIIPINIIQDAKCTWMLNCVMWSLFEWIVK